MGKGTGFAVAAGVGAAMFIGLGSADASADETGDTTTGSAASESRDADTPDRDDASRAHKPVRNTTATETSATEAAESDDDEAHDVDAQAAAATRKPTRASGEVETDEAVTTVDLEHIEGTDDTGTPEGLAAESPTGEPTAVAPRSDVNATATTAGLPAQGNQIVYTDPPTAADRIVVAGLRVLQDIARVLDVDLDGLLATALERNTPPWFVRRGLDVRRTEYAVDGDRTWTVWEFRPPNATGKTVVAVHGGEFITDPLVTDWLHYAAMARDTGATVIVPLYPPPTAGVGTEATALAQFLSDQIAADGAENVSIYAHGTSLALAAVRELIFAGKPVPAGMVLLSAMSGAVGPLPSPLLFEDAVFAALPPTTIYVGELEPTLPDALLLQKTWSAAGGVVSTVVGLGQLRNWTLGGNSAAPKVRPDIYRQLGLNDVASGPRTVTTGPPTYSDRLVADILRTLRWLNETTGIKLLSGIAGASILTDPPPLFMLGLKVTEQRYNGWKVWEIASHTPSGEYVVALHGGGFESEANVLHWTDYAQMVRDTGATVLVPIYPLAPPKDTGTAETLVPPMADYLAELIAEHGVDNVSLYGDSSGGSYAMLVVREMLRRCGIDVTCIPAQAQPSRMVLVSPALHLTLRGPEVDAIDDPILPRHAPGEGPRFNGSWSLDDPRVNPYAGADLTGLPPTTIYIGTQEKLYPGALAFRDKVLAQDPTADLTVVIGDGQLHGWALGGIVVNSQAQVWRSSVYRQLGLLPTERYVTLQVA